MNTKLCQHCNKLYEKPKSARGKRWTERKYCTVACQRKAPKGVGQKKNFTPEGLARIKQNLENYRKSETDKQKKMRIQKTLDKRVENGWTNGWEGKTGKTSPHWLDNSATYNSKHRWIQKHWEKTGVCEDCRKKTKPFGRRKWGTEWANMSGKYDRNNRNDWKELCVPCHRRYDGVTR